GGRSSRFGEFKGFDNKTLRYHLKQREFKLDTALSVKLTEGYKGTSKVKTKKFLEKGFRQIKEKYKEKLLEKGYREPMISKIPEEDDYRYFEFYHPQNPFVDKTIKQEEKQLLSPPTPHSQKSVSTISTTPQSISSVSTPQSTSSTFSSPQSFYSPPSSSEILRQTPPEIIPSEITKPIRPKTPKKYDKYGTEIRSRKDRKRKTK